MALVLPASVSAPHRLGTFLRRKCQYVWVHSDRQATCPDKLTSAAAGVGAVVCRLVDNGAYIVASPMMPAVADVRHECIMTHAMIWQEKLGAILNPGGDSLRPHSVTTA